MQQVAVCTFAVYMRFTNIDKEEVGADEEEKRR